MTGVLPFSAFLDLLRVRGYGVGLREYAAFGKLLDRWPDPTAEGFADAAGALLGRSAEEVDAIRRLFIELYLPERALAPSPVATAPVARNVHFGFLKNHPWAIATAAALVVLVAIAIGRARPRPSQAPPPAAASSPQAPSPTGDFAPIAPPAPALPRIPDPPKLIDRRAASAIVSIGFLAVLALTWWAKAGEARRRWLLNAWAAALAAVPGPHQFRIVAPPSAAGFARQDIEDAATILSRAFTTTRSRELDVPRTLRRTLRRALLPELEFKARRTSRTILVFEDISLSMRVWAPKVEALLRDLRRQGLPVERWYFDGDPARVMDRRGAPPAAFDALLRRHGDSAVMVISAGTGLAASLEKSDTGWVRALGAVRRRTWLTPVTDLRLWPASYSDLPVHVWPMSVDGLAGAARDLAGLDEDRGHSTRQQLAESGRAEADDVERLKRLASLVPNPSLELLEALRREFAADIPDAAIAHLMAAGGPEATTVLRLDDAESRRCVDAVRRETPQLEAAVRSTLLEWLQSSRPPEGSLAHQRWTLAIATQQLMLADLNGADPTAPLATIRTLGAGPLWEEVGRAFRLLPSSSTIVQQIAPAHSSARPLVRAPAPARARASMQIAWTWPGARELVPAAIVASIIFAGGQWLHAFPARTIEHVTGAYALEYVAVGGSPVLRLQRSAGAAGAPSAVTLFQENAPFRNRIVAGSDGPTEIRLAPDDTGHFYQVRAALPGGNLALSNAVWVPSDRLVTVMIDASPWANVTVRGSGVAIGPEPTPVSIQLLPGRYQLHLENGGVTPPADQAIDVTPENRSFRIPMPGFDPATAAGSLLGVPVGR